MILKVIENLVSKYNLLSPLAVLLWWKEDIYSHINRPPPPKKNPK